MPEILCFSREILQIIIKSCYTQFMNPTILRMTRIKTNGISDWKFHMHAHKNTVEITWVFQGKGSYFTEGHVFPMQEGDLVIKNANVRHGENAENDAPLDMVWIELTGIENPDHVTRSGQSPVIASGSLQNWFNETVLFLYSLFENKENQSLQNALAAAMYSVILALIKSKSSSFHVSHGEETIRLIMQYLDLHYTEKIEIADLSDRFHISQYYLMRLFHTVSGVTINTYINNCRIGEAQRLLSETDMPLKDISDHCGFDTVQYFHQVFKKTAGETPTAYRLHARNHQN